MRSIEQYQSEQQQTYLNFSTKPSEYEIILKYCIENNIKFCAKDYCPTLIGYDIETFIPIIDNL